LNNPNGVYNTLAVLGQLDHGTLGSDLAAIRSFSARANAIGPKTAGRAEKLLGRRP
jgi:hypothetical protein